MRYTIRLQYGVDSPVCVEFYDGCRYELKIVV